MHDYENIYMQTKIKKKITLDHFSKPFTGIISPKNIEFHKYIKHILKYVTSSQIVGV